MPTRHSISSRYGMSESKSQRDEMYIEKENMRNTTFRKFGTFGKVSSIEDEKLTRNFIYLKYGMSESKSQRDEMFIEKNILSYLYQDVQHL